MISSSLTIPGGKQNINYCGSPYTREFFNWAFLYLLLRDWPCEQVDWIRDDVFMADAAHAVGLSLASPRRRRSAEERRLIVEETLETGSSVDRVAMKHGVNANQVFKWRRLHEAGRLGPQAAREVQLLPVRVAEEQEHSRPEAEVAASAPRVGSIRIELPGSVRISLEGHVDPAMVRAELKSLRS